MKRKFFFAAWLLAPVAVLALHYGPGQWGVTMDTVADCLKKAEEAKKAEKWNDAELAYAEAIKALPPGEKKVRYQLEISKAEARMFDGETPEAIADLQSAMNAAEQDGAAAETKDALLAQLSAAHYYAAWLVRLENVSEEEWKIQCELARQGFRYLAEKAAGCGDAGGAELNQKNLENAIRLARMDLNDLKALPLPKQ